LASMAVLSLAAPLVASDGEEAMLQALSATLEAHAATPPPPILCPPLMSKLE